MECLPLNENFSEWFIQYGSITLFVFLVLGIIAFPIPDETLMILAGVLVDEGKMHFTWTLLAAYAGSICGITISYILGRTVGHYFILRHGSWVGMTEERLGKVKSWFERYGKWTLIIGYFVPGVRHFTGVVAGMADVSYGQFSLFAYTGAILWSSTFLSIGYFFGAYCLALFDNIELGIEEFLIFASLAIMVYVFVRGIINNKSKKQ